MLLEIFRGGRREFGQSSIARTDLTRRVLTTPTGAAQGIASLPVHSPVNPKHEHETTL
jgi:hypothetical protein